MVMFSNNVEPANGFLLRYLHRKAVENYQEEERDAARHQALLRVLDWIPQLWYNLHTFLEKHSTSDFLIGERLWTWGSIKPDLGRWVRKWGVIGSLESRDMLTGSVAPLRSLLLPVVPSNSGRVQAVVH